MIFATAADPTSDQYIVFTALRLAHTLSPLITQDKSMEQ